MKLVLLTLPSIKDLIQAHFCYKSNYSTEWNGVCKQYVVWTLYHNIEQMPCPFHIAVTTLKPQKFLCNTFCYNLRNVFNQNCSFKMKCIQNYLTHSLSGYSLSILRNHGIYEIRFQKKFCQCMTLKYRHKNSTHTHTHTHTHTVESLVAPLNKSATFFKHHAQQNCFDYKNNNKLHRMTT